MDLPTNGGRSEESVDSLARSEIDERFTANVYGGVQAGSGPAGDETGAECCGGGPQVGRPSEFIAVLENVFRDERAADQARNYWLNEFCTMPSKTRGSIVVTFTSMADYFLSGMLRPLFCEGLSTVTPDAVLDGKIIVVALPVLQYQELGIFANVLFKLMFQRGMLRRSIEPDTKPVFLWADEAQETLSKYDTRFQSVARSFRVATVYSAQNSRALRSVAGSPTNSDLACSRSHGWHDSCWRNHAGYHRSLRNWQSPPDLKKSPLMSQRMGRGMAIAERGH